MKTKKIAPRFFLSFPILLILLGLNFASCASTKFEGKAALTGRVCDENGIGVANYYVSLGLGNTTVTNESGVFVFKDVGAGEYHLTGGGYGWCETDTKVLFLDKKSIVCLQVEKLESLFPKIESLLREERFDEAKKIISKSKEYNEKNPLYLFYRNLISYCEAPSEKRKKSVLSSLEKI